MKSIVIHRHLLILLNLFAKFKNETDSSETQSEDFSNILDKRLSEIKQERSDELERWKEKENDKR